MPEVCVATSRRRPVGLAILWAAMAHQFARLEGIALELKSVAADRRTFAGLATTPDLDRQGHSVDPAGVTFRNPIPLFLEHDRRPVGFVTLGIPTAAGVPFEATIPTIPEPGTLRDRVNEAWHLVKSGLIRSVSIGFRVLEDAIKPIRGGGARLLKTEVLELSLTSIPANPAASILFVKSLTAIGPPPGVALDAPRPSTSMTLQEQIRNYQTTRDTKAAELTAIMATAGEQGLTLDPAERDRYDTIETEVKSLDDTISRFKRTEQLNLANATAVPLSPTASRFPVISVKSTVPPGTAFVRATCAQLLEKTGRIRDAVEYAKRWDDSTPEVALYLKAATAPGTSTDATWAAPLVNQNIAKDFIELLRPATILGKIPGLRVVPFNTKVPSQSAGGTYGWVGESKPKPVTKLAFASTSLGVAKAAGIIVLTKELIMLSEPNAEDLVRKDMIAGIAQFLDAQFIDPAVAAVAGVNPASITNGAPTAAATTNPMADIMGLISHFATNNIAVDGVTFIMSAANALSLSFRSNLDGSPQYPGITVAGGEYKGLTFITSQAAGGNVIALQPSLVLYADGGIEIDASQEASLQMDSAPMSPADATTVYVSLWQTNSVGLRAERFVNWAKANANAVKYLTATAWPAPAGMTADAPNGGTTRASKA